MSNSTMQLSNCIPVAVNLDYSGPVLKSVSSVLIKPKSPLPMPKQSMCVICKPGLRFGAEHCKDRTFCAVSTECVLFLLSVYHLACWHMQTEQQDATA